MTDLLYPAICPGHQMGVVELCYSRRTVDGLFFMSACLDKLPMLRDAVTGDWIGTFAGHKGAVWSAALNGDATLAATGSADFTVKVWDPVCGAELATLEHGHVVKSVSFSRDGRRLATGGGDRKLRVYAVDRLGEPPAVAGVPDRIRKVAWAHDDSRVFTGTEDGAVRAYDAATLALVAEAQLGAGAVADLEVLPPAPESAAAGSGRGSSLPVAPEHAGATLTVAAGREVLILDAATLAVRARHRLAYAPESASLHPAHRRAFVAGGSDVHVHIHDAATGAELACHKGHHGVIHAVRFAPDGDTLTSGADDAIIRIWKFDDGLLAPGGGGGGSSGKGKAAPSATATPTASTPVAVSAE